MLPLVSSMLLEKLERRGLRGANSVAEDGDHGEDIPLHGIGQWRIALGHPDRVQRRAVENGLARRRDKLETQELPVLVDVKFDHESPRELSILCLARIVPLGIDP